MKRRDFLKSAGAFIVAARILPACGDDARMEPTPDASNVGIFGFPQGVASGDPRTTSVVLWTRAVSNPDPLSDVALQLQVATDDAFSAVVVDMQLNATIASDHAVRVMVTGLTANTAYYYRFTAGVDKIEGRTRTAPADTADVQVNLAWVSCQDYQAGQYGAYAQMIADDDARPEADRIQFVVHLGDTIYETSNEPSQRALTDTFEYITLKNADGSNRVVPPFPSGGGVNKSGARFARTLDDYRHLYKTFFSDPNLQAARARWPFIHTWDDHEFSNDCWQSMANYVEGSTVDEPSQARKYAANHAWFEYVPVMLTGSTGPTGVTQDAKDFTPATVTDAPFTAPNSANFVAETNNAAAIGAVTIYRSLRWGKHVELVMTDQRSYRSDHAIPEDFVANLNFVAEQAGLGQVFFDPRNFLPVPLVNAMDAGAAASTPAFALSAQASIPNPRAASPLGTMLGAAQKQWWKDTMKNSTATWKLWGNEVPMMRMLVKSTTLVDLGFDRVLDGDAWDGYNVERRELLGYLLQNAIANVVCLTGDIHAAFAGNLVHNYDLPVDQRLPVAVELIAAGISSNSLFSFYESATRNLPAGLRGLVTVDATAASGKQYTENLNLLLLHGSDAAATYAATKSVAYALANADDPDANPHLKYVDTDAQGYGYCKVTEAQIQASLVTINRPVGPPSMTPPGVKRAASFTVTKDTPVLSDATITGTKPFPVS